MNLFVNIPVPAANGAGAPVSVAAMGAGKTIVVGGGFDASVTIEYATDLAGTIWAPVPGGTFDSAGRVLLVDLAARWMRAVVEGYRSGAPNADVGGSGSGALFVELVVPTNGAGASVDISLLPALKTVVLDDNFKGAISVEVSEDGVSWTQAMVFNDGGGQTLTIYGQFARARHDGGDGTPSLFMGAARAEGTGIELQDDGVPVPGGPDSTLNFIGAGVQVTDAGNNTADVTIAGSNLVFRPGGVQGGNVYTVWADLMAALALIQGYKTIQFDNSIIYASAASAKTFAAAAGIVTLTDPNAPFTALMVGQSLVVAGSTATLLSGAGAKSFAVLGGVVTYTDADALFTAEMVGRPFVVAGSTTAANNSSASGFTITGFIGPTQITYVNSSAVAEAVPPGGTWSLLGNNGTFTITGFIGPTQITYANALGAAAAFAGTWAIGGTCIIPAGTYSLVDTELTGFRRLGLFFMSVSIGGIPSNGDVIFSGLSKIDGDISITNLNRGVSPITLVATAATAFELGTGPHGDLPFLTNNGPTPFFNGAALLANQTFALRMHAQISGLTPLIQLGASPGNVLLVAFDSSTVAAGMVAGTNVASTLQLFAAGNAAIGRQSGWAGTVSYGLPSAINNSTGVNLSRQWMRPASLLQAAVVPSTVALTFATGMGMNTTARFAAPIGGIAQALPIIRAAAPAINSSNGVAGVLESGGLEVTIKNDPGSAGSVSVTPSAGETIDGGAGPVVVAAGESRTFRSDGVSNWLAVGEFSVSGAAVGQNGAMFFGLTAGTGNGGASDYAATVAVGAPVPFPQAGPTVGAPATLNTATDFLVAATGVHEVSWNVGFLEASQLQLAIGGVGVANTTAISGAGTQLNQNTVLVNLVVGDLISVINPPGNVAALTVQTADGSLTHAQAPSLVIKRIS